MKKFFTLLCVAMIAFGINAAPQIKGLRTFEAPVAKQLNKTQLRKSVHSIANLAKAPVAIKHAPAQVNDLSVEVTIDNITSTTATVTTTPDDNNVMYFWDVLSAEEYTVIENGDLAADYGINDLIDYGTFMCFEQYDGFFIVQGVDTYEYEDLTPQTEYVVVVYAIDVAAGVCTDIIATENFETPEPEPVEEFIGTVDAADITATSANVAVAPEGNSPYYWDILPLAMYDSIVGGLYADEYGIENLCDFVKNQLDYIIYYYYQMIGVELGYSDILHKGDSEMEMDNLSPSTEYVVFALSIDPYTEECVGEPATYNFTTLEPDPIVAFDGTIVVSDITSTSANVAITSNTDSYYYLDWIPTSRYDSIVNGLFANQGIADLAAYVEGYIEYAINYYAQQGQAITYFDFLYNESVAGAINVNPDTEYTLFAISFDPYTGVCVGEPATFTFTTESLVMSDNQITMAYDGANLNVTTTNNDSYFFWIEPKADYDKYEPDFSQASLLDELAAWEQALLQYQIPVSYALMSGNKSLEPNADFWATFFEGNMEAGVEYVALAAPYAGLFNGTAAYCVFTYGAAPQAIENAAAKTVATKALMNNQIVLIKNGKKFNLLGAKL